LIITVVLFVTTTIFSVLIFAGSGWLNATAFFLAFMIATGVGGVIRKSIEGGVHSPVVMFFISTAILVFSFWLGGSGQIHINFARYSQTIYGEWWCVIAGPLAGLFVRDR
jgi:hypothetical protein